jgi:hypothetical protein
LGPVPAQLLLRAGGGADIGTLLFHLGLPSSIGVTSTSRSLVSWKAPWQYIECLVSRS